MVFFIPSGGYWWDFSIGEKHLQFSRLTTYLYWVLFNFWFQVIQESLSVIELEDDASKGSFLWRIESNPPSYFFGTIHVPYIRVWDAIPNNVKNAFAASKRVYFELDLTKQHTISSLSACQKSATHLRPHYKLSQHIWILKQSPILWGLGYYYTEQL